VTLKFAQIKTLTTLIAMSLIGDFSPLAAGVSNVLFEDNRDILVMIQCGKSPTLRGQAVESRRGGGGRRWNKCAPQKIATICHGP